MVTPKGSISTEGETLQISVLPYRCSKYAPLCGGCIYSLYVGTTVVLAIYLLVVDFCVFGDIIKFWVRCGTTKHYHRTVATRVAGTWLQDWHLPRHQGCTYRAPVR
jgi:hypothetical protein